MSGPRGSAGDDVPRIFLERRALLRSRGRRPVVELDGDEITRTIWEFIEDKLILP
jgi:hypothetical protein